MSVDQLVTAIINVTAKQDPILAGVGRIVRVYQAGRTGDGWAVRVADVLTDEIEIRGTSFSQPFRDFLATKGQAAIGLRVLVIFVNQQPLIAFTLGG